VTDEAVLDSQVGGGITSWTLQANLGDLWQFSTTFSADGVKGDDYSDCVCNSHSDYYLYANDHGFSGSNVGSDTNPFGTTCHYSLEWDITGPFQTFDACTSGPCGGIGEVQVLTDGDYYDDEAF
jgi:hypothetical protein